MLPEEQVRKIMDKAKENPGMRLHVDLEAGCIWDDDEEIVLTFAIEEFRRYCLLEGLDDIGLTVQHEDEIAAYEARRGL